VRVERLEVRGKDNKIILASQSPRRKELLGQIFDDFDVVVSDFDESSVPECEPREYVQKLSFGKCAEVAGRIGKKGDVELVRGNGELANERFVIISADTIVVHEGRIFGKPKDFEEAVEMLTTLSGKWHEVYTGVTVMKVGGKPRTEEEVDTVTFSEASPVKIKDMSRTEIEAYVNEFHPYDKAGAYALQEGVMVEEYKGSYSNIVGLPLEKLRTVLNEFE
jgi:septum formation protein